MGGKGEGERPQEKSLTEINCLMLIKNPFAFPHYFHQKNFCTSATQATFSPPCITDLKGRFSFDETESNFNRSTSYDQEAEPRADWLTGLSLTTVVRADVEQRLVFELGWAVTEHEIGSPQGDAPHLQPADQLDQFTGTHERIAAHIPETRDRGEDATLIYSLVSQGLPNATTQTSP